MTQTEKPCIYCAQSCAGQPRVKDAQGNYAHKSCAQQHQSQTAQTPPPIGLAPEEPEMAAFLDDLPSTSDTETTGGIRAACPGCGTSVTPDAVICMNCGVNIQTGKATKTEATNLKPTKETASESTMLNQSGEVAIAFVKPIIGACIGGAIGAALWAAIAYYFNYEVGYVAILVGLMTGFGAVVGAGGGGDIVAIIAVVVAVLSIATGKYIAINAYLKYKADPANITQAEIQDAFSPRSLNEFDIYQFLVDVYASEQLDLGETIQWPNPETTIETAIWPDDYPEDLVEYTIASWDSMSFMDKQVVRNSASNFYIELATDDPASFFSTDPIAFGDILQTMNFYDVIWLIAAMYGTWHVAKRDY